jgi:predicted nucleic acid-binding protein
VTAGYLLDTNHIGHAVTHGSIVRRKIVELRSRGVKVGTCVPVFCEIEAGIRQVSRPEAYHRNLELLLRQIRVWPIGLSTAAFYGAIHHELKRRGRVLSQVDMMVAALARQLSLKVATSDLDYAGVPGLFTEDWLASGG